jgi:hypothetical protein
MKNVIKVILVTLSVLLNAALILFFVFALSTKSSVITFYNAGVNMKTAAVVASAPVNSNIILSAPEITMRKGEQASLQFSLFIDGKQSNYKVNTVYDHSLISTTETGYGVLIAALEKGETIMQAITSEGVTDVAKIIITD